MPQFHQGGELGFAVLASSILGGGDRGGILGGCTVRIREPRVGNAQTGDDGQQFALRMEAFALQQRPRKPRVQGQPRHRPAAARDAPFRVERLEFLQQAIAIAEGARIRRIDEGKVLRRAEPVGRQPQQQCGKIGAQHLGFGKHRAAFVIGL
jgi:hypothetical protein